MYLSNKNKYKIYYLYFENSLTGKINKVSTRAKKKQDALLFFKSFKEQSHKTISSAPKFIQPLIDEYINHIRLEFTYRTYRINLNTLNIFTKLLPNKKLNSIRLNDLEFFKAKRFEAVNKTTVNIDIRNIKALFNYAYKLNYITDNPAKHLKEFKLEEKEILNFSDKEITLIFKAITNNNVLQFSKFALYTGMRISEILNLQINDIDLEKRLLIIRNKNDFKTKSGKIRIIPITNILYDLILEITDKEQRIYLLEEFKSLYLFRKLNKSKFSRNYISMEFKKALRKAGLDERFNFHCLRHTYITNMITEGNNIFNIKNLAGHSNIKTTLNYCHFNFNSMYCK